MKVTEFQEMKQAVLAVKFIPNFVHIMELPNRILALAWMWKAILISGVVCDLGLQMTDAWLLMNGHRIIFLLQM